MKIKKSISRRDFLRSSIASGSWMLAINAPLASTVKASPIELTQREARWCVYISIRPDNSVIMESPVTEMGQFMRTTGPMLIAEEMDLDWKTITFTDNASLRIAKDQQNVLQYTHVNMNTGGSHSVRWTWEYLRQAGAIARRMLVEAAAKTWKVPVDEISTKKSKIYHQTSGKEANYSEFYLAASKFKINMSELALKPESTFTLIGKDRRNIDVEKIVTGQPRFGIDMEYPNCLQAVIYRAPAAGAEIVSYDQKAALAIPGVVKLVEMTRMDDDNWFSGNTQYIASGIAVIATTLWAAIKGRKVLKPTWKNTSKYADHNSARQMTEMTQHVNSTVPGEITQNFGDLDKAFSEADIVLESTYHKPLFAHALMEPLNCIADIQQHEATIITGHQFPIRIAEEVERFTDIPADKIKVICTPMGSGLGRRAERDWVREAILLSKNINAPVKVTWLREDEIERDLFDPASVTKIRAAMKGGKITAWHHRQAQTKGGAQDSSFPQGLVENYRVERCDFKSEIPGGAWRGPQHPVWAFAAESMIDELAYASGIDPLAFRIQLMLPAREFAHTNWGASVKDSGRMAQCYKSAAALAQWQKPRGKNIGLGIAGHFCHGSYAAFVVEVKLEKNRLKIREAWGAIDCGLAINPNHIRAQMEGGFIDGLQAALFNKIDMLDGKVQNNQFDTFTLGQMRHAPIDVHTEIIVSKRPPTGVGEPPTAPAIAALVNAIFAASGRRIRQLPLSESFTLA